METVLFSKEFDDRFRMLIVWRKASPSPLRVRIVYDSMEIFDESFELSVLELLQVFGDALKASESLLVEEVESCGELFRRLLESDGNSLSQSHASQEVTPASV